MCTRFTPLSHTEAQSVLDSLYKTGSAHIRNQDSAGEAADAYPGTTVPLFVLGPDNKLFTQSARWGFESDHLGKLLFNTRIETACNNITHNAACGHVPYSLVAALYQHVPFSREMPATLPLAKKQANRQSGSIGFRS